MRRGSWVLGLAFSAWWSPACSSARTDCVCTAVNGGERRVLACGTAACVGGTSLSCADKDVIVPGGSCTTAPPATGTSGPEPTPPPSGEPDESCADLATLCATTCTGPDDVAADCQATATTGDAAECAAWPLAEGALCQ